MNKGQSPPVPKDTSPEISEAERENKELIHDLNTVKKFFIETSSLEEGEDKMDAFRKYYSKFQDLKFKMTMDTFKELEESGKNRRRQCLGLSLKTFIDPSESHQNSGLAETTDQTNTNIEDSKQIQPTEEAEPSTRTEDQTGNPEQAESVISKEKALRNLSQYIKLVQKNHENLENLELVSNYNLLKSLDISTEDHQKIMTDLFNTDRQFLINLQGQQEILTARLMKPSKKFVSLEVAQRYYLKKKQILESLISTGLVEELAQNLGKNVMGIVVQKLLIDHMKNEFGIEEQEFNMRVQVKRDQTISLLQEQIVQMLIQA